MRAIHLKSFDYRVLNLLLYKLRGEEVSSSHHVPCHFLMRSHIPSVFGLCFVFFLLETTEKVNELHMEFLSVSEFLVEVADDLYAFSWNISIFHKHDLNRSESWLVLHCVFAGSITRLATLNECQYQGIPTDQLWYVFPVGRRAGEQFQCFTNVCGNVRSIKCTHWAGIETLTRHSINVSLKIHLHFSLFLTGEADIRSWREVWRDHEIPGSTFVFKLPK